MHRYILSIFMVIFLSLASAEMPKKEIFPKVTITEPSGGQSSKRMVSIKGTIADPDIKRAYIIVNSSANLFEVSGGNFSYELVLAPGENVIQVVATNHLGTGRDTVVIYSRVPKRDVKVVMTWNTPTDIDLHVIDPTNEETYYSSKESKIGGQLDRDDTDGFGPETFLLSNALEGKYIVKCKYYGGVEGQTLVKITVVLFEGTPKEWRRDHYRLLTQRDEFVEVCSFWVQR